MIEFEFKRPTRRCTATERDLRNGEEYYSVLTESSDGELIRQDYSTGAWQGPPTDCVGWWKARIPDLERGRVYWAPPAVLLAVFEHALQHPAQAGLTYVMALLLVQRRILQWRDSRDSEVQRWMLLHEPKQKRDYEVPEVVLQTAEIQELQQALAEKLFTDQVAWDEAPEGEGDGE
jgi:hypothetical protein